MMFADDIDTEDRPLTPTEAALLRPDGTAALVRITPDTDTIQAVLGDPAYGYSTSTRWAITFWAKLPQFVFLFNAPHGKGESNALAGDVYRTLTGKVGEFRGPVLTVNASGTADLDAAVCEFASEVRDLRSPIPERLNTT